jgi:hypothetical protein
MDWSTIARRALCPFLEYYREVEISVHEMSVATAIPPMLHWHASFHRDLEAYAQLRLPGPCYFSREDEAESGTLSNKIEMGASSPRETTGVRPSLGNHQMVSLQLCAIGIRPTTNLIIELDHLVQPTHLEQFFGPVSPSILLLALHLSDRL